VQLPRPLHEQVIAYARHDGMTVNAIVATAVREWLQRQPRLVDPDLEYELARDRADAATHPPALVSDAFVSPF
jgi:hypothetical protein